MRKPLIVFLCTLWIGVCLASDIVTEGWKTYLSYHSTNLVEESSDRVYTVAQGALFSYGKDDNSLKTYYKGQDLSDNTIAHIRYNRQTASLLIVYENANIDLLTESGSVVNLPYLANSTTFGNKQINHVALYEQYAYLSTAFGILVVDMRKQEIKETYNLQTNITACTVFNNTLYAATDNSDSYEDNLLYGSLNDNLLDKGNWRTTPVDKLSKGETIADLVTFNNHLFCLIKGKGLYQESGGTWTAWMEKSYLSELKVIGEQLACIGTQLYLFNANQSYETLNLTVNDVSTYQTNQFWIAEGTKGLRALQRKATNSFEAINEPITLNGPYSNSAFDLQFQNNQLYLIPGGKALTNGKRLGYRGAIIRYDLDQWSYISPEETKAKLNLTPRDYTSIAITTNEAGDELIYATSFGDGVVAYTNGVATKLYDERNSPIENAAGLSHSYCYMDGAAFDREGNLWVTNSEVSNAIKILDKEGNWHAMNVPALRNLYTINDILITSNDDKWINVPRVTPKIVVIKHGESLDEAESNELSSFTDTDGNLFTPSNYTCMAEDKNGYVWVGTNRGAIYFTRPTLATDDNAASLRCNRVKMEDEESGELYYFLDNVFVTTIKVDQGNQKWIGTQDYGVYVLSSDNSKIVHQFNTSNSPLLSDNIYDIEINNETGEVFIGTDKGLNSYLGEATEGKTDYAEVYAYPNPVRPEYQDKVNIVGLMSDSNVKITDISGHLIYQTKSLGGQATWNCRNYKGERVASGVYLVMAATPEGKESVVTKIIIIK